MNWANVSNWSADAAAGNGAFESATIAVVNFERDADASDDADDWFRALLGLLRRLLAVNEVPTCKHKFNKVL